MKIHYVYAGNPGSKSQQSPYTVTRELYRYLRERCDVAYYDWCTMGLPEVGPDDVILGHPHYDPNTVVQQMFARAKCRAKCLIFPLHHGIPEYNLPFDGLVAQADRVFSIMGPYWYDTLEGSAFAHWKPKITRLDMAVDSAQFPYLRTHFNPEGCRHLVYIGHARPEKNVDYLIDIMRALPSLLLHWYGGDSTHPLAQLPNVRVSGWLDFNRETAASIIHHGDIFINVSRSDANPTTLLEAASWGLIPVCTKQSGYWANEVYDQVYLQDEPDGLRRTLDVIHRLQGVPEPELLARAARSSGVVRESFNWERFGATVWDGLKQYV